MLQILSAGGVAPLLLALAGATCAAAAEPFPTQPARVVVPAAGGGALAAPAPFGVAATHVTCTEPLFASQELANLVVEIATGAAG